MANRLHCFLDQPTPSGQFGFSIKFYNKTGIFIPKSNVLFHHTAIEHKINMALQKFARGASHYCNFKRTALGEKMLCTTTTKLPSRSRFYVDFKTNMFKDQKTIKNWNTDSTCRCLALCQVDLWAETRAFHKLLQIFQKVSRNFSNGCSKVAQKIIKGCFLQGKLLKSCSRKQKLFLF